MMEYPVMRGNETVGTVRLTRKGLYWEIFCKCRFDRPRLCRLEAEGEKAADLGVLVPEDGCYILRRTVPIKRIGEKPTRFTIREDSGDGCFLPLDESKPFAGLQHLGNAYFAVRAGVPGIVLKTQKDISKLTGQ